MKQKNGLKPKDQLDLQRQAEYLHKNKESYWHVLSDNKLSEQQLNSDCKLITSAIQRHHNQQQTYGQSEQQGERGL